jgi:hypothetical protein
VSAGHRFWEQSCQTGQNVVATPTAVVRTSVQHAVGGYRKELPHSGDLEMWLRIAARADVATIAVPQAFKRMHGQNMQIQYVTQRLEDVRQRYRAFESGLASSQTLVADALRLEQTYREVISLEAFWAGSAEFDRGNVAACEEWLMAAREFDPSIVRRSEWRRFSLKQRFGTTLWNALRPWMERLRA